MASRIVTVFSKFGGKSVVSALLEACPGAEIKFVSTENVVYDHDDITVNKKPPDDVIQSLQDAEILISEPWLVFSVIDKLPNLKWMQGTLAGVDAASKIVDLSDFSPKFTYTRLGGAFTNQMAQYVMGYILSIEKQIIRFHTNQQNKIWDRKVSYRKLDELTIGILGAGDIGTEVARVCKSFRMKTWGLVNHDLPRDKRSEYIDEYRLVSGLQELLANCDYLCSVLPSTSKTIGLLSGDVLSHCTKKPVFINIGRGDVISEDSIVNAIKKGWISQAVLDVFEKEPLPQESPLWTMPEVILTPHCSGVTMDYSIVDTFSENYQRYINGLPLKYVVEDWSRGY